MASTRKPVYVSNNNTVTITLASLANAAVVWSSAIDNTTNLFDDIKIQAKFKTNSSGISTTGYLNIRIACSADSGTTYDAGVLNTDVIAVVNAVAATTTYYLPVRSIAALYGGILPPLIKIGVENQTGNSLTATGSDHGVWYEAEQEQLV